MIQENSISLRAALTTVQSTIEHIRSSINSGRCNNCGICNYIAKLNKDIVDLLHFTKSDFPIESDNLMTYLPGLSGVTRINAYDFGGIIAIINIISAKINAEENKTSNALIASNDSPVKIFISHSSKDKSVVESFINLILRLGCGLQPTDVLCSSIEATGIKTGKDIRDYLQKQLLFCDYAFFMISDNYLNSSICLNEMGGAWVLDKDVKPFLFPESDFADMGWLYEISKGAKLDNDEALDELRDELLDKYKLIDRPKTSDWTAQKKSFFKSLNSL